MKVPAAVLVAALTLVAVVRANLDGCLTARQAVKYARDHNMTVKLYVVPEVFDNFTDDTAAALRCITEQGNGAEVGKPLPPGVYVVNDATGEVTPCDLLPGHLLHCR